jgi:hypothetical protein
VSPTLDSVRIQAEMLASTCLSEPWSQTERKIVAELPSWQEKFVETEKAIMDKPDSSMEEANEQLNQALERIFTAVQSKDAVALSNALAYQFVETLNILDRLISNP